jgi:membrane fusion protein
MQPTPLFRPEVQQSHQQRQFGEILTARRPAFRVLTLAAATLGAGLIAFVAFGHITRKATVGGLLVNTRGSVQVTASTAGVLVARHAAEGDFVTAGQTLFEVATDKTTKSGATAWQAERSLASRTESFEAEQQLRILLTNQRRQALGTKLRALRGDQEQAAADVALTRRRVELATKSASRYAELAQQGYVPDIQYQQKQEELLDLQSKALAALRAQSALHRDITDVDAELKSLAVQGTVDGEAIKRNVQSLQQERAENEARQKLVVVAPQAGVVTALLVSAGAAIQPSQALATIVPQATRSEASTLEAHLYAPSKTAGFVRPGQSVYLRYAAYPYQKFGLAEGVVVAVSSTPINQQDLPEGPGRSLIQQAQADEPMYRIRVRLKSQSISAFGESHPLKSGLFLDANILQERVALWQWVMQPVYAASSIAKVLTAEPSASDPNGARGKRQESKPASAGIP